MATAILMPQLGMAMTEATIGVWLVADGATVRRGDQLLEIETDKISHTVEAPADGVLQRAVAERQTLKVQEAMGYLLAPGEMPVGSAVGRTAGPELPAGALAPARASGRHAEVLASPLARRLAAQHGLDLAQIEGSGPNGRAVEADVLAAVKSAAALSPPERQVRERLPLTGRRKLIAERMLASLAGAAQLTVSRQVEASELVRARQALLERAEQLGVRVSYDAILAKILATALSEMPVLNAMIEDEEILLLGAVHVAVAVAAEAGLIVPVVPNVDSRPLLEVARMVADYGARSKQGTLSPDELSGGTVTLTNLGVYGVDTFTPILNPPQAAILGIGHIEPRAIVKDGDLVVRPACDLSLTWDHRIADGATAAQLLARIAELVCDRAYLASLL